MILPVQKEVVERQRGGEKEVMRVQEVTAPGCLCFYSLVRSNPEYGQE